MGLDNKFPECYFYSSFACRKESLYGIFFYISPLTALQFHAYFSTAVRTTQNSFEPFVGNPVWPVHCFQTRGLSGQTDGNH
jgi:hypothetical protein